MTYENLGTNISPRVHHEANSQLRRFGLNGRKRQSGSKRGDWVFIGVPQPYELGPNHRLAKKMETLRQTAALIAQGLEL